MPIFYWNYFSKSEYSLPIREKVLFLNNSLPLFLLRNSSNSLTFAPDFRKWNYRRWNSLDVSKR